ncbi:MAG: hypothetical protein F4Z40_02185 [Chloroflexi bacterium]|nr:hypothetical protein [Chloroflexota bacterium]
MPGWLPDLDALSDLRLGRNRLSGEIPDDIGRLQSLLELGIERNLLAGPVPESIGSIPGLLSLDLSGNQLEGQIPPSLASLAELEHLDLSNNRLGGSIPAALGNLGRMRWLNLAHNRLEGLIPEEIAQLSRLRELFLEGNGFEGCAPNEIRRLRSTIDLLEFGGRPFCDLALSLISVSPGQIRPEFDSARHDYVVDVPAPESSRHVSLRLFAYQELQAVAFLDANGRILADADSQTGGFQLDIAELTADDLPPLMSVEVISGDLKYRYSLRFSPARAGEAGLYAVLVDGRPIFAGIEAGEFSHRVGFERGRVRVEPLALDPGATVNISPPDADQVAENGHQVDLAVGANSILIEVTPADGQNGRGFELALERLAPDRDILIQLYEATGGPAWSRSEGWLSEDPLGDWHGVNTDNAGRVVELELGDNGLSGPLPAAIADLVRLRNLDLRKNRLSGEIPSAFGQLSELVILELSGNRLSGPLPDQVAQLPKLLLLSLDENELSGPLPTSFGNAAELIGLGLAGNEFTGPVPESFGNLPALGTLRLAGNRLGGCLPATLRADVLQYHDFARLGLSFCDVGIRALPLNLGRLLPAFSPGDTRYRLFVEIGDVSAQLSLAPELFNESSEVSYLGPDLVPLVDADPRSDGFQINLSRLPADGEPFELSIRVSNPASEQTYSFAIELAKPGEVGLEAIGVAGQFSNYSIGSSYLRRLVNHQSERITIEPRTIDPAAVFEFLAPPVGSGGPLPLPDADGEPGNGFQFDTASGPNILLLRVQSADSSRVRIYALVIVRTPGKPSPPAIAAVARSPARTEIYWSPPDITGGSQITGYDLRYIYAGTPEKSDRYWTMIGRLDPVAGLSLVLDGLEDDLSYEFQIRARNRAGAGPWSDAFAVAPAA